MLERRVQRVIFPSLDASLKHNVLTCFCGFPARFTGLKRSEVKNTEAETCTHSLAPTILRQMCWKTGAKYFGLLSTLPNKIKNI